MVIYLGSSEAISFPALHIDKQMESPGKHYNQYRTYGIEFSKMAEKTVEYTKAREMKAQPARLAGVYRSPSINMSSVVNGFQIICTAMLVSMFKSSLL